MFGKYVLNCEAWRCQVPRCCTLAGVQKASRSSTARIATWTTWTRRTTSTAIIRGCWMGGISLDLGIILVPILIFFAGSRTCNLFSWHGRQVWVCNRNQPSATHAINCNRMCQKNQKLCDIIEQSWEDVQLYDPGWLVYHSHHKHNTMDLFADPWGAVRLDGINLSKVHLWWVN